MWTEPPLSHVWEAWGTHQPRLLPQMFNSQPNTRIEPRLSIATRQTPMMPTRSASANTKSWKCQMSVADGGRQRRRQARRVSHPATISSCCEIATRNSRTPSTVPTDASIHALTNFLFVLLQRIPCWYFFNVTVVCSAQGPSHWDVSLLGRAEKQDHTVALAHMYMLLWP